MNGLSSKIDIKVWHSGHLPAGFDLKNGQKHDFLPKIVRMVAWAVWPSARIGIWWGERPREPGRRGKDGLTTAREDACPTNAAAPTGLYPSPVGTGECGRRPDEGVGENLRGWLQRFRSRWSGEPVL